MVKLLSAYGLDNKLIGIWFPTYKDLSNVWTELLNAFYPVIRQKDEQLKTIHFITGGRVDFWSMEEPDSGRGRKYHRVLIDEAAKAKKFKRAWTQTIRPTLTDYAGDAWFFSTPKGKTNYFYQLQLEMTGQKDWAFFHFTSYDNPYLDPKEIDAAKAQLDDLTFRQEYLAEDVDANDRPFFYAFDEKVHVIKKYAPNPHLSLFISFDFNKDPMTSIIGQVLNVRQMVIFDEIRVPNGSTPELCEQLISRYGAWLHRINITGDASGHNRNPLVRGGLNHYVIIKKMLNVKDQFFRVRRSNLSHINSRILCNSVLQNAEFKITENCKHTINDMRFGAVDEDGSIIKTEEMGMHFLDNVRYLIDAHYYDFITKPNKYAR